MTTTYRTENRGSELHPCIYHVTDLPEGYRIEIRDRGPGIEGTIKLLHNGATLEKVRFTARFDDTDALVACCHGRLYDILSQRAQYAQSLADRIPVSEPRL